MNKERISIRAVIIWLVIWEAAALLLNKEIFLVSPVRTLVRLGQLAVTAELWIPAAGSLLRIVGGYVLALAAALVLSRLAFLHPRVRELAAPFMAAVKAVPVASFVILALICFSSRYLAVFLSFLIVTPLVYSNALAGYDSQSRELSEMADVFGISKGRRLRYVEIPQLQSHIMSAAGTGIGMAWKAGVAAEVIGTPNASIGDKLYRAKVYLETPDLLAWTVVVIVLAAVSEKIFIFLLSQGFAALKSVPEDTGPSPAQQTAQGTGAYGSPIWSDSLRTLGSPVKPEPPGTPVATGNVEPSADIICDNISKSYGETVVYNNYNRVFPGGKTSVVMAPSGAGKTTLLKMIAGLEKPDSGSITGVDRVSVVFQDDRLLDYLTACGNIKVVMPSASDSDVRMYLTEMGIPENELKKPVGDWSGGMKRRAALLRALMADGVLLLDEPFKGLDPEAKEKTIRTTKGMAKNRTLILVTHDKEENERIKK